MTDEYSPLGDGYSEYGQHTPLSSMQSKVDIQAAYERQRDQQEHEAQERRQQRSSVMRLVRVGIAGLSCVVAVGCGMYVVSTQGAYTQQYEANAEVLRDLEKQVSDADVRSEQAPSVEVVQNQLVSAKERGDRIAELQNEIYRMNTTLPDQRDPSYTKATNDMKALREQIRTMVTTQAKSGGTFSVAMPWLVMDTFVPVMYTDRDVEELRFQVRPVNPELFSWRMETNYEVDASSGVIPVLWTARMDKGPLRGELLAWVTATYDPKTGMFGEFTYGQTPRAAALGSASSSKTEGIGVEEFKKRDTASLVNLFELGLLPMDMAKKVLPDDATKRARETIDKAGNAAFEREAAEIQYGARILSPEDLLKLDDASHKGLAEAEKEEAEKRNSDNPGDTASDANKQEEADDASAPKRDARDNEQYTQQEDE